MNKAFIFIALLSIVAGLAHSTESNDSKLFQAIAMMEGSTDDRFQNGEVGRYCITEAFYIDGSDYIRKEKGSYPPTHIDMMNPHESRKVIIAYWKRYCPKAYQDKNYLILGAIFRKGPKGYKTATGLDYGNRLTNLMESN